MVNNKFLVIVLARGGSKGIKNKNMVLLNQKPLIYYTIDAAIKSQHISDIFVSSDSENILEYAKSLNVNTILRPYSLATDTSTVIESLKHAVESIDFNFDYIVLLQPTSPLRDKHDIEKSIQLINSSNANSLISVYEIPKTYQKAFTINNGYLKGLVNDKIPFSNRQTLNSLYMPNGAIYIVKRNFFLENQSLFTDTTIPYIMSHESSIDIDTLEDIQIVETILRKKK
jgi:N-acylneuraminate cytidylyltransferase